MRLFINTMHIRIISCNGGETDTAIPGTAKIRFSCDYKDEDSITKISNVFFKSMKKSSD